MNFRTLVPFSYRADVYNCNGDKISTKPSWASGKIADVLLEVRSQNLLRRRIGRVKTIV